MINLDLIQQYLEGKGIIVKELIDNNKASEKYIRTTFIQDDGFSWDTVVPYENRRTGLNLNSENKIADYLMSIKPFFQKEKMKNWIDEQRKKKIIGGPVTSLFFEVLLSLKEEIDTFPQNNNPQRRIQDIKDAGYTVASIPNARNRETSRILLPLPLAGEMGYETFTNQFKARVIRLLCGKNVFEAKQTTKKGLVIDHKFSEIRWDEDTKSDNSMSMTDEEILQKFQLLDNQRNLQKREVCRICYQEGKRGVIYGIPYFYEGTEMWDSNIPTKGKNAEKGCIGCAWYDIERWRKELLKELRIDVDCK
ncbi:MAG: hypothetical protein J6U85_01545 [Bacteroidales bacterium]|nr:hypothetical protein [Bacteroidales bacterium]